MIAIRPESNPLEHVQELNHAFLSYLRMCTAEKGTDCLGLPQAARRALRKADDALLDAVAEFPRALFKVSIDALSPRPQVRDPVPAALDSAQRAIQITIAFGAWTLSRQSVYQSRLLLALDSRSIQRLRALPIGEVHELAEIPRLVSCAFPAREWLWTELLTETRPEARRQLLLVALQPRLESDWPNRQVLLYR